MASKEQVKCTRGGRECRGLAGTGRCCSHLHPHEHRGKLCDQITSVCGPCEAVT